MNTVIQPRSANLHIPSLDGIRAGAVTIVFLAHAGLNDRIPGNLGVTVFFFLSGYLITTLLRLEFDRTGAISLKAFYLRRALRILPPMYLVLGAASALTAVHALEGALDPGAVLAQVAHLSNYYIIFNGWWDGRAPGTWIYWSLAVEEHFYLLFPQVYLALRRFAPRGRTQCVVLLAACALVLAWRLVLVYAFDAPKDRTYVATDTRVDSILFGCALAVYGNPVLDRTRVGERWWKWVLVPLGAVGLLASFLPRDLHFEQTFRYSIQGLALFPLFIGAIRYPAWGIFRLLNVWPIAAFGLVSYTFYLVHPTVLFILGQWLPWPPIVLGGLAFLTAIGVCGVMYHAVERPCARLRKRLSRVEACPTSTPITLVAPRERTMSNMHVSAIICTRNRPDLIGAAVRSVLANTYRTFDVLVVDQSTDDRTGAIVRGLIEQHANLRYLHTPVAGLSRAYNIGLRETTGEVLAFTDDDCIAPHDWIGQVAAAFATEPDVDMLYGQVLLPAALAGRDDDVPTLAIAEPRRFSRADGFRIYGMGANFAARRRLFAAVGDFDEVLGGGGPLKSSQDYDLQYRAYLAGATVALRPEVKIEHYGLRTADQWPATHRAYGTGDGAFYMKHARCGDLLAVRMLAAHAARLLLREVLHALHLRRRWSRALYLQGFFEGMRGSLRYAVDRQRRLYVQHS